MYRRLLVGLIATSCLLAVLACGAGAWGIHRGLVRAPTGVARIGNLEVLAFTGVEFSTVRSPRGYYTIWVGIRKDSNSLPRPWHPLRWAHQVVWLEVPPARAR
jgi:hypothetical protein